MDQLSELTDERVHRLIEQLPPDAPAGSLQQKVGDFYRAFLDQSAIDAAGLQPARPALDAIANARTYAAIATLMGRPDLNLDSPLGIGISIDEKNPDRYLAIVTQSGLGLPDRDYYLSADPKFAEIRGQYRTHLENILRLADAPDAARRAQDILELETKIAELHWPTTKRRSRGLQCRRARCRGRTGQALHDGADPRLAELSRGSLSRQRREHPAAALR
jgi:predicted metalloendopeptidase